MTHPGFTHVLSYNPASEGGPGHRRHQGIGKAFHRDYWGMPRWKACNEYTVNDWKCETPTAF
jgi:hypothetical protein